MLPRAKKTRWEAVFMRAVACFGQLPKRVLGKHFFGALQPFKNAASQLLNYPPLKGTFPGGKPPIRGELFHSLIS